MLIKDLKIKTLYKTTDGYSYILAFKKGQVIIQEKNSKAEYPIVYFVEKVIKKCNIFQKTLFCLLYLDTTHNNLVQKQNKKTKNWFNF